MKRVVALIIACAMSLALFGCGKKDSGSGKNRDEDDKPKATTEEVEGKFFWNMNIILVRCVIMFG